jgi:hypothetical protein
MVLAWPIGVLFKRTEYGSGFFPQAKSGVFRSLLKKITKQTDEGISFFE